MLRSYDTYILNDECTNAIYNQQYTYIYTYIAKPVICIDDHRSYRTIRALIIMCVYTIHIQYDACVVMRRYDAIYVYIAAHCSYAYEYIYTCTHITAAQMNINL